MSFITDVVSGKAAIYEIDDYIDDWHAGDDKYKQDPAWDQELHEFLGMTQEEYQLYLNDESSLSIIIEKYKQ